MVICPSGYSVEMCGWKIWQCSVEQEPTCSETRWELYHSASTMGRVTDSVSFPASHLATPLVSSTGKGRPRARWYDQTHSFGLAARKARLVTSSSRSRIRHPGNTTFTTMCVQS